MKEYLPIIKARIRLFRGIEESVTGKAVRLTWRRESQTYRKEEYI